MVCSWCSIPHKQSESPNLVIDWNLLTLYLFRIIEGWTRFWNAFLETLVRQCLKRDNWQWGRGKYFRSRCLKERRSKWEKMSSPWFWCACTRWTRTADERNCKTPLKAWPHNKRGSRQFWSCAGILHWVWPAPQHVPAHTSVSGPRTALGGPGFALCGDDHTEMNREIALAFCLPAKT